jgi:hypothetical protein
VNQTAPVILRSADHRWNVCDNRRRFAPDHADVFIGETDMQEFSSALGIDRDRLDAISRHA